MRHRADNNSAELVKYARRLGVYMHSLNGTSDWLALLRGQWEVVEIKNPDKEGHADEFTPRQQKLHKEVWARGGRILVWRRETDIDKYVGVQVGHA